MKRIYIIKRDGRKVLFDHMKIVDAILAAFRELDGEESEYALIKAGNIADYIAEYAEGAKHELTIEEIQDLVEHGLMSLKRKDVARAYISYRDERTKARNRNSKLNKTIREKITASNPKNQNANVDEHSFGGRLGEANSAYMKEYALNECLSPKAKYNHINNIIYTHDLDHYAVGDHNCLSIPFDDLLANGFNVRQTDVRPANSVNTAFQLVAVIFQVQSLQQFGGVSATHLDWTMVPYVRKSFYKHYRDGMKYFCNCPDWSLKDILEDDERYNDIIEISITDYEYYMNEYDDSGDFDKVYQYAMDMTIKEVHQAVEGMYHNLNTLQSRSGN